jgi:hypothetical protein
MLTDLAENKIFVNLENKSKKISTYRHFPNADEG